ncbi:hypothetical protein ACFLX2_01065 [Candidatus Dependentiae bacterium]
MNVRVKFFMLCTLLLGAFAPIKCTTHPTAEEVGASIEGSQPTMIFFAIFQGLNGDTDENLDIKALLEEQPEEVQARYREVAQETYEGTGLKDLERETFRKCVAYFGRDSREKCKTLVRKLGDMRRANLLNEIADDYEASKRSQATIRNAVNSITSSKSSQGSPPPSQ